MSPHYFPSTLGESRNSPLKAEFRCPLYGLFFSDTPRQDGSVLLWILYTFFFFNGTKAEGITYLQVCFPPKELEGL